MLKKLKRATLLILLVFAFVEMQGQQNVFSRDAVTTGDWESGLDPWYYEADNIDRGDPDNATTPNFIRFGHNNNLSMTLNGRAYRAREIIFEAAASSARTIGGFNLEMRPNSGNCKIENYSIANHLFNNNIAVFAPIQINPVNGDLTISGDIITNDNFIDVFGNNAHNLIINGIVDGSSGIGVQQNSTVVLNGSNSYGGGTFINDGKIIVNSNNSLGSISGSTTIGSGGTLELDSADQLSEPILINGLGLSGSGAIRKVNSGTDQFSGSISFQSDARIHIDQGNFDYLGAMDLNDFTYYLGGDGNFNFESSSSLLNATKTSFDGALFKDGSGKLEFRPSTSMTGNLFFLSGEVRQFTGAYPSTGLLILGGGLVYRSDGATDREVAKPTRIDGNITLGFGTGANSEIDFLTSVDFNGGNHTLTMTNDNFISGVATSGSFTKAGTGSLTIQGSTANTLSDGSSVNAGMLILAKTAGIQATSGLSIQAGAAVQTNNNNQWGTAAPPVIQIFGGTLNMNNTNQRLALAGDAAASVTLGSGTITIDGSGAGDVFAGVISGTGGLTKEGTGKEILTGTNTYTGSTTIAEGTLELGASNVLSNLSAIVLNGGTLRSTGTIAETMGTLELAQSSTIDLNGTGEVLTFTNSSGISWNADATLTIQGWTGAAENTGTSSKVFVGNAANTFTDDQLLRIQFDGSFDFGAALLPSGELVPKEQNSVRFDDFNRGANLVLGSPTGGAFGTWIEMEAPPVNCTTGAFIKINTDNQLELTRGSGGTCSASASVKSAAFDVSALYATRFEEADSLMEWYFNMQHSDAEPSGQNRTAYILGSSISDFSTGSGAQGYAVALGESGSSDDLHLISFDNGLPNTTTFAQSIIAESLVSETSQLSVKVTFDPCSDEWTLTVREDGASFKDPTSVTSAGGSAIDITHVDKDLIFLGAYREHSTTGTRFSLYDNIYIPAVLPSSNAYTWDGSAGTDYQNADNWTPRRICSKPTDVLNFSLTANDEVTNVPSEFIEDLNISGAFSLTLRDIVGGNNSSKLTIRNGSLNLDAASALILDVATSNNTGDAMEIELIGSSTAILDGDVIIRNSNSGTAGRPHRLFADGAGAIQVNGTIVVEDLTGSLFDGGIANSVEFNNGSVYECSDGGNPFGLTAPSSRVVFETGSTFRYLDNAAGLSIPGRVYSNIEFNTGSTETLSFNSNNPFTVDSLLILSGTLNVLPSAASYGIFVAGNLRVENAAIFNFDPAEEVKLTLNGNQGQRIYGTGTITLGENVIFSIDNSAVGSTVELEKDLTVFNDFELLDGELQGNGSDLTMAGDDHTLLVEGELEGEVVGAMDEIDLVINANTTLSGAGSVCNFLNVTVVDGFDLRLNRGLQIIRGTFLIEENARLVIGDGGFIETTDPDYERPTYEDDSFLIYDSGLMGAMAYGRGVEWGTAADPGYPSNVSIIGTTNLSPGANSNTNTPLSLSGDLFIEAGSGFFLDFGGNNMNLPLVIGGNLQLDGALSGSSTGGDVNIQGNWSQSASGSYFPIGNKVLFNGSSGQQSISVASGLTLADSEIDNIDGLLLNDNLRITGDFNFNNGIVFPAVSENLIFEDNATASNPSNASFYGGIVIKEGDDEFIFPVGDSNVDGVSFYQPVRMFDLENMTSIEAQYFAKANENAGPWYDGSTGANGELEEVGNCDYWEINKTTPGTNNDVRLAFKYTNPNNADANPLNDLCNDIANINSVFITSFNSLEWDFVSTDFGFIGDEEIATIELVDETLGGTNGNYGPFTFRSGNGADNVLPITLLSFRAEAREETVFTNWITAAEINNDFFTLERSKDGNYWEKVGTIDGAGDSHTELSYSSTDQRPYSGISYYRLSQTDFDGTTTLSAPRAVEVLQGDVFGLDRVYRGQDGLSLIYRATAPYVVVEIYDLLGKRIHGELIENYGNGFSTIHPHLARGAYILRLSHGSEIDSEKFVW